MTSEVERAVRMLEKVAGGCSFVDAGYGIAPDEPDVRADLRTVLAALRAQAERVRVLEGNTRQLIALRMARPTLDDLQFLSRQFHRAGSADIDQQTRINDWLKANIADDRGETFTAAAEARAEAAERRAGELEGLLEEASNAMRMTALAMEAPLGRPTKKHVQHWTSLFHAESQRIRAALLPATQADGGR